MSMSLPLLPSIVRFCLFWTGFKVSSRNDPSLGTSPEEAKSFVVIIDASGRAAMIVQVPLQSVGRSRYNPVQHGNENLVVLKNTLVVGPQSQAFTCWQFSSGERLGSHGLGLYSEGPTLRK